jgi:stalled ribosome rescue protein Dom34
MSNHFHAVVWIDHHQARVFHFNATQADEATIHSSNPHSHLHHKANAGDSGHVQVDKEFLKHVSKSIEQAGAILICGPSSAKTELMSFLTREHPQLAAKVSAVETLDHPTDGQIVSHARTFFKADDRMH